MLRKSLLALGWIFFIGKTASALTLWDTESSILSLDIYSRNDLVTFKNVVDLSSGVKDDNTVYFGIDYSLAAALEFKDNGPEYYLKLERNGPGDYDAPVFVHNTVMTSDGVIDKYHNEELLPNIEEVWMDLPLFAGLRFKPGLYTYEVGEGFSLNGAYENFGVTLSKEWDNAVFRLYYCRPDSFYKHRLGPRIHQDREQDYRYHPNAANFFASDIKFRWQNNYFNPYIGALTDYTSPDKRENLFTVPIKSDILGTIGFALALEQKNFSWAIETAHNFGEGKSKSSDYKDVAHTGYMFYSDLAYSLGRATPSFKFLLASGNKLTPQMATDQDATFLSGKNRAFSYFSPFNTYLSDTIGSWHSEVRPLVFMGNGYSLNYGLPRPSTSFSSDFDNLIILAPALDFEISEKCGLDITFFYLQSFQRGIGTFEGEGEYLSRELGYELNINADYRWSKNLLFTLSTGYFFPGKYYKSFRDDSEGSVLSPYLRGDGKANSAYLVELSAEITF